MCVSLILPARVCPCFLVLVRPRGREKTTKAASGVYNMRASFLPWCPSSWLVVRAPDRLPDYCSTRERGRRLPRKAIGHTDRFRPMLLAQTSPPLASPPRPQADATEAGLRKWQ